MVRRFILVAAICGALEFSALEAQSFAFQEDSRPTQETIKKKVSSRKKGKEPTHETATAGDSDKDSSLTRPKKVAATPLKPMIDQDALLQDDAETTSQASTSNQTQSATNQLSLRTKVTAPDKTILKQPARISIAVTNRGSALTESAILIVWLPKHVQLQTSNPELTQQDNGSYEYLIHEFAEKATQEIALDVIATTYEPIQVRTQIQMLATQEIGIQVGRPELKAEVTAPEFSFQNAENLYSIDVRNDSPVELTRVRVVAEVPEGLQVTKLNRAAKIDDQNRTLIWDIGQLGAQATELIQFKAIALQSGAQSCQITAESAESEPCEVNISTMIDARPDLKIGLNSHEGPIQISQTTTWEMTVENRGSEAAKGVELEVVIPEALQAEETEEYQIQGNRLVFPAADLEAGELRSIPLRFTGTEAGEHIVRAEIKSQTQRTIATEDTVFVYDTTAPRKESSKSRTQRESN